MPAATTGSRLGVIGGSGVYQLDELTGTRWEKFTSRFGEPSDDLLCGSLHGQEMVFLPRHGRGHRIPPHEINYLANIDVLRQAGVDRIISVSAVGSLKEHLTPGTFVLVDQFIDRTTNRKRSFFGTGHVAHVSMAHPTCPDLGNLVSVAARDVHEHLVNGGTYIAIEGPQFSTIAESNLYRSWSCDVIGMTNMPEARLAREAGICYSVVAMVTDFDCWHPDHDSVSVAQIVETFQGNVKRVQGLLSAITRQVSSRSVGMARECNCAGALDHAVMTAPSHRTPGPFDALS